ncbi:MAG: T9SS type A sorting domain-containing protein [Bacteroidia bacterium]|nr:T9SS type A sorting domain-containing protein [Bacteroidia bacterium]
MFKKTLILFFFLPLLFSAQNALVFNGGFAVINGGTGPGSGSGNGIYVVVNQTATTGITRLAGGGGIISESQFNYVKWLNSATTGAFLVPFYKTSAATDYIPFTVTKTSGAFDMMLSTWGTPAANTALAIANGNTLGTANGVYPTASNLWSVYGGSSATAVDRWWDVNAAGTINGTMTFSYMGAENTPALAVVKAQVWKNVGGTYQWEVPVYNTSNAGFMGAGAGNTSLTANTALTGFWLLIDQTLILENTVVNSDMTCSDNLAKINWTSENENGIDHYVVEKSQDGINYFFLSALAAQSLSCQSGCGIFNYNYNDPAASSGYYYRLSAVKTNGETNYIKTFQNSCADALPQTEINFYSYGDNGYMAIQNRKAGNYNLKLFDAQGKLVLEDNKYLEKGSNTFSYNLSFLAEGVYVSRITSEETSVQRKFVITK